MKCLLSVLLLATTAVAQAALDRECIAMMPGLSNEVRGKVYSAWDRTAAEWRRLAHRIREIEKVLEGKPAPGAAKKAREELARSRKVQEELVKLSRQRLLDAGLTEEQLARFRRMPTGPARYERYNHGVTLEAPDLTAKQHDVLEHLVAATDAAQLALVANREQLKRGVDRKEHDLVLRQIESRTNRQFYETEKRFWRVAYYALTPAQMRAVRQLLAPRSQGIPQLREQMLTLPGLTPSQASRITAAFTEHDSERSADTAVVRRVRELLRDKSLDQAARDALARERADAYRRLGEIDNAFRDRLREILSQEQRDALNAAPPMLNLGERNRPPNELLRGLQTTGEQRRRVAELDREAGKFRQEVQQAQREAGGAMMGADLGPESPQQMTMMVMYRGAQEKMQTKFREIGSEVVLEILTPSQLAAYVVGSGAP